MRLAPPGCWFLSTAHPEAYFGGLPPRWRTRKRYVAMCTHVMHVTIASIHLFTQKDNTKAEKSESMLCM